MDIVTKKLPKALRNWFLVHFIVDFLFAIPLMFAPVLFLGSLGWQVVDPIAARLVAAALIGIGLESLLCYKASAETYRSMLNLKIIWSTAAITGLIISMLQEDQGRMLVLSLLLLVFLFFNGLWVFWRIKIAKL